MDLYAVMTEIDTRLRTITGLRVAELGMTGSIAPPMAVQYVPDRLDFDKTWGRGLDEWSDHVITVCVGLGAGRRTALKTLAPFLAGTGAQSIKAKIDSTGGAYTSCTDVHVEWAEIDIPKIGGTDYLAALFHSKITGTGA